MNRVLIVDDNQDIQRILSDYGTRAGYQCDSAYDGKQALNKCRDAQYDVILLDLMMPNMDGLEVCRRIRSSSSVPIIIISARGDEDDRIYGLDLGADDYIAKPFSSREVFARVKAVLRRTTSGSEKTIRVGGLVMNPKGHVCTINGKELKLTKKEAALLAQLALNAGRIMTRENLLEAAWFYEDVSNDRAVDTHIKRIRAKLREFDHPGFSLETVWGVGYCLKVSKE